MENLPYRVLAENATATSGTSIGGASYEILELANVNASWQPIYLALFLTLIQSFIFLCIFEWGRRNKYISSVFDRRRTRHPTRTPAPLMRQKGCANGWLAFEWWKVRISDEDYQKDSWDEFRLLQMEEQTKHRKSSQQILTMAGEEHDPYMLAAENSCYRESPFFAMLEKKQNDVELGYNDAQPERPRGRAINSGWKPPKPIDAASSSGGSSIDGKLFSDSFSMGEDSSIDADDDDSYDSDTNRNARDDSPKASTETTTATSDEPIQQQQQQQHTVSIEYNAALEKGSTTSSPQALNTQLDYGYGDDAPAATTDYGYGEDVPAESTDYGYGEDVPAESTDYGYGEDVPAESTDYDYGDETSSHKEQTDYGHGDNGALPAQSTTAAAENDLNPSATAAATRNPADYGYDTSGTAPTGSDYGSSTSTDRLTLFTGDVSPHPNRNRAPSLDEIMGNVVTTTTTTSTAVASQELSSGELGTVQEHPAPAPAPFNLDNIMGNVSTSSKKLDADTPTFNLDNVIGNVTTSSKKPASAAPSYNLDNIMGNVSTSTKKPEANAAPVFNLDNIMGNVTSNPSIERRSHIEDEIKAVEEKIEKLKRRASDDAFEVPDELPEDQPSQSDGSCSSRQNDDLTGGKDLSASAYDLSDGDPSGSTYDVEHGPIAEQGHENLCTLVPMKKVDEEHRPMIRRPRKQAERSMSLDLSPKKQKDVLTLGGSMHDSKSDFGALDCGYGDQDDAQKDSAPDYGYGDDEGDMAESQAQPPPFSHNRRCSGGETPYNYNRRCSGGETPYNYNRRSSGGDTFNRRSSGHPNRRESEGAALRRRSGDGGVKRGMSMGNGDIMVDPRATITNTSHKVTDFLKNRVLMMSDDTSDTDDEDVVAHGFVASKISKRRLSPEDKELLRCIGLDSFMTLRFLHFGFDVSFWPMLLSLVTLIPICKTANNGVVGFFSTTAVALTAESWRYWLVMVFGMLHFGYILRRIWIEWEVFLPLRSEFLENGDFEKEKYKEQYRKTCMVEYIPRAQKHDKALYEFFDAISPGGIERAEVLLNTEHLRYLIKERMKHLTSYEDVYAKKVQLRAEYLRKIDEYEQLESKTKCLCSTVKPPLEPTEPTLVAREQKSREPTKKFHMSMTIQEAKRTPALKWHYGNIQRLNREINEEYLRLAQAQRRPVAHAKESRISRWLGIKYLTGSDTGRLHSSTAFVQFKTLSAKQHAIQCNITGMHNYLKVSPVPEVRDIIWDNMHVSRALVETRKAWANVILIGGLVLWSMIVSVIRSFNDLSATLNSIVETPLTADPAVSAFLDFYAPALIVEGLVRAIPNIMKVGVIWIRFKSHSERDHYILRWYFGYRLLTFLFIIIGGTLVKTSDELVQDPIDFFKKLSGNVALNAQFFISYVIVSGGIQVFFRLSQWHNLALYFLMKSVNKAEAMSQRKLEGLTSKIQVFHLDEFIPLFIFIFMVGALYGTIAPLSNFFVAGFFYITYKVFKYMTLFVYGNHYQGGGFLFYTISSTLFYVLYVIILLLVFFFSVNGSSAVAGCFSMLLFVTAYVQNDVHRTFVVPSKTLSLAKSRAFDERQDTRPLKERKHEEYMKAKKAYDDAVKKEEIGGSNHSVGEKLRLIPRTNSFDGSIDTFDTPDRPARRGGRRISNQEAVTNAVQAFNDRYNGDDPFEETDEENPNGKKDNAFFIYRQPSLNKATWEMAPKPYRPGLEREEAADIWGDVRPEQTRKVARQRRASIAMYYGG